MQWYIATALAACIAVLGSCSGARTEERSGYDLCVRGVGRTPEGVLRVCDRFTQDLVVEIEEQLLPQDKEIILTSGGGETRSAMDIARIIKSRGISIRVRQFCLSACSTYVLPAAPRVSVDQYAIVAFHYTGAFYLEAIGARSGIDARSPIFAPAIAEREFYREIGLDPALLDRFSVAIQPTCMGIRRNKSGSKERYMEFRSAWFVPDRADAEAFIHNLEGYWPQSASEVEGILRPTTGNSRAKVVFGWPDDVHLTPAEVAQALPEC